jgi:hypothetical protein
LPCENTREACWSNTDHRVVRAAHPHRLAEHTGITGKDALPELIADHRCIRRRQVLFGQRAAQYWRNTEDREVVARHGREVNITRVDRAEIQTRAEPSRGCQENAREHLIAVADGFVRGIAQCPTASPANFHKLPRLPHGQFS